MEKNNDGIEIDFSGVNGDTKKVYDVNYIKSTLVKLFGWFIFLQKKDKMVTEDNCGTVNSDGKTVMLDNKVFAYTSTAITSAKQQIVSFGISKIEVDLFKHTICVRGESSICSMNSKIDEFKEFLNSDKALEVLSLNKINNDFSSLKTTLTTESNSLEFIRNSDIEFKTRESEDWMRYMFDFESAYYAILY